MPTNEERAHRALQALRAYEKTVGEGSPGDYLTDLLTDLRHFCASEGLDFGASLAMSETHFNEEGGNKSNAD